MFSRNFPYWRSLPRNHFKANGRASRYRRHKLKTAPWIGSFGEFEFKR